MPPRYGLVESFLSAGRSIPRTRPTGRDPVTGEDLYLPEGWGGPSAEDFARAEEPDEDPNSPSAQLRGTMFDFRNPTEAFLERERLFEPPEELPVERLARNISESGWFTRLFRHQPEAVEAAERFSHDVTEHRADESLWGSRIRGFLGGAAEGAARNLTSVTDVLATVLGLRGVKAALDARKALKAGRALSEAFQNRGRIEQAANIGANLLQSARGAGNVAGGVSRGITTPEGAEQALAGLAELAGGTAGTMADASVGSSRRAARQAGRQAELDAESRARHEARMEQARVDQGRDFREFNRWRNDPEGVARATGEAYDLARGLTQDRPRRGLVTRFLEDGGVDVRAPEPGAPELAQRLLGGRTGSPTALPEGTVARFLADDAGGVRDAVTTSPESRMLPPGRGEPIVTPPPREPFRGPALQASLIADQLTDGELRMAFIDAASAGDMQTVARLETELARRPAVGAPSPDAAPTTVEGFLGSGTAGEQTPSALAETPGSRPTVVGATPENIAAAAKGGDIVEFAPQDVGQIALDPQTYQFKTSDARGRTGALEGVTEWDPWSPPIVVHRTPEGRLFVADGHQRFNKYLELTAAGQQLPPLRARVVEGPVQDIVRAASLRNVQEGSADPMDIARLIRNGGDLTPGERARVGRLSSTRLRQGQDLARLGDDAFTMVLNGAAKPEHAAFVGRYIDDPAQQATALQQLGAADIENVTQAEVFVKELRDAGFQTSEQVDLFGNRIVAASLAEPKAKLYDAARKALARQRSVFKHALANARRLEEAGNVLAGTENARLADEATKLRAYLEALYNKPGTATHAAINEAAVALHNRQTTPSAAVDRILDALRRDLEGGSFGGDAARLASSGKPAGAPPDGSVARGPVPESQGSLPGAGDDPPPVDAPPAAPPKKARTLLEEHLGPEHKTLVREVMDDIVARHPKDPAAQAEAARQWIAEHPERPAARGNDAPWTPRPDGGEERLVEGAAGAYREVRFAERPPVEVRERLMAEGFKYDFRTKSWRQQPGGGAGAGAELKPPQTTDPGRTSARRQRAPRAPRAVRARARQEAQALPEGTDPNLKKALESGDPEAGVAWVKDAQKKSGGGGSTLASGFGAFEELFRKDPQTAWMLTRMAVGAVVGFNVDEEDPWLGFLMGAGIGAAASPGRLRNLVRAGGRLAKGAANEANPSAWRAAKEAARVSLPRIRPDAPPKTRDLSFFEFFRRPEAVVPEHFERIQGGYQRVEDFLAGADLPEGTRDLHGNLVDDPFSLLRGVGRSNPKARTLASGVFYQEALSALRKDIKAATDAKQFRRARYLELLERAVLEKPAHIHEMVSGILGVSPARVQKLDNRITNHAYRILLGLAADSAIANLTQIGFNVKNVPFRAVARGAAKGFTKRGRAQTGFATLHRPLDADQGTTMNRIDDILGAPMRITDTQNRRGSYLAAYDYAIQQGASPKEADQWAKAAMRQTQGEPGPAGKAPFLREMGPLRVFQNYPLLWAEIIADTIALRKENPVGAARMAAYLLGGGLAGGMAGINTWNVLFPRFAVSLNAHQAPFDLAMHVAAKLGLAEERDHTLREDILGEGGKTSPVIPRYPRKVYDELRHLAGYGVDEETGEHITRDPRGRERSRHTTLEGLLNLGGMQSTRQAEDIAAARRAYEFTAERKRETSRTRRSIQRELAAAIDSGDHEKVSEILSKLPARTRREVRRAVGQTKWQRLRSQVPKRDRREFDAMFGEQMGQRGARRR